MLNLRYRAEFTALFLLGRIRDYFGSLTCAEPVCTPQCVCFLLLPWMACVSFFLPPWPFSCSSPELLLLFIPHLVFAWLIVLPKSHYLTLVLVELRPFIFQLFLRKCRDCFESDLVLPRACSPSQLGVAFKGNRHVFSAVGRVVAENAKRYQIWDGFCWNPLRWGPPSPHSKSDDQFTSGLSTFRCRSPAHVSLPVLWGCPVRHYRRSVWNLCFSSRSYKSW